MDLIFDSSTLILLAKITLLRKYVENNRIKISQNVKPEILFKKELEDTKIIEKLIDEKLIEELTGKINFEKLIDDFSLDKGEAESLAAAINYKKILATDDWKAIKACKVLGIKFITTIHCLIQLYNLGKIDQNICLEKLKNLEKFGRYNPDIIRNAKNIVIGEKNE